jgi:hypothetical protein
LPKSQSPILRAALYIIIMCGVGTYEATSYEVQ